MLYILFEHFLGQCGYLIMMTKTSKAAKKALLSYLLFLTLVFALTEISIYITTSKVSFFLVELVKSGTIHIPPHVLIATANFFVLQVLLYLAYAIVIWAVTRLTSALLRFNWSETTKLGFTLWSVTTVVVLMANQVLFPASGAALVTAVLIPMALAKFLLAVGLALLIFSSLLAAWQIILVLWCKSRIAALVVVALSLVGSVGGYELNQLPTINAAKATSATRPNVIIIGIDSLRNDYADFGTYDGPGKLTPHLDQFLKTGTIFDDAMTPIARTFPSWVAILTGQYPIHNGARNNLADQSGIDVSNSFGHELQRAGYYTIYATDDRRFSNVSHRFGFNQLIGPWEGVNDFVLGTINTLPLSNLIVNTRLGKLLFPYSYGNRAAYAVYQPSTFRLQVERKLVAIPHNKPLFLAIHFCMPHWPYAWSKRTYDPKMLPVGLYRQAIVRGDVQIWRFIQFLKREGFLKHAIVVVLSDHGEALLEPHDRVVSRINYIKGPHSLSHVFKKLSATFLAKGFEFDTSYGHGTDVLSPVQYNIVFAWRLFGMPASLQQPGHTWFPVSTLDIKPTILSLLHSPITKTDGFSLTPFLHQVSYQPKTERPFFIETGFTPEVKGNNALGFKSMILQGAKVFKVLPNGKLEIKPSAHNEILATKQRAEFYKNWELALYPISYSARAFVLVNLKTGLWTDDLSTSFAKHSPAQFMKEQMRKFYGKEVSELPPFAGAS